MVKYSTLDRTFSSLSDPHAPRDPPAPASGPATISELAQPFDISLPGCPARPILEDAHRDHGKEGVEHLLGLGRRTVATIAGPSNMCAGIDRLEGYLDKKERGQL
jgi:hypothetical protein